MATVSFQTLETRETSFQCQNGHRLLLVWLICRMCYLGAKMRW